MSLSQAPTGRRERKRRQTMHAIQEAAVDLFDRHGFEGVTIEQVAEAADVSPSTVYRHFGTKEGLIVHDEFDLQALASTTELLRDHDLITAFRLAMEGIAPEQFEADLALTMRRVRYLFEVESVQAAALATASGYARALAEAMADAGSPLDAVSRHAQAAAVIAALFAAFEQWWNDGATEPILDVLDTALLAIRFADPGRDDSTSAMDVNQMEG